MPVSLNNTYMVNKDGQLLTEAYLSALQKYHNLPQTIKSSQPDDTQPAETLEDRMQGVTEPQNNLSSTTQTFDDVVAVVIDTTTNSNQDSLSAEARDMAKSNLYTIYKASKQLHDIINSGHELDYWMYSKLSICADSISNISRVAEYDCMSAIHSNNTESISTKPSL
jgi:hypothetical protein